MTSSDDQGWQSFGQWIEQGDYAPLVLERRLTGRRASLYRMRQQAGEYPDPATPDLPIQIVSQSTPGRIDLGSGKFEAISAANSACVAPAHSTCSYVISQPFELTILPLPGELAHSVLDDVSAGRRKDHGVVHGRMLELPELTLLIQRLWLESEGD